MVLTVTGVVIGCDSDDTPTVTAPAPSGGGGGNGQAAVEFDATATAKGQQCGSASSTEIRNTCSDVPLNVRVQCVTATGQPFGSVQHLRLAPGAAMPGDPLGCTGSGGETLQAPSLARSSHVELLTIRSNYCPDPYLYIYGDITNGRLKFSEKGTGGCIHPDKLNTEQRRSEMVPTEPTAPIPSFEEVKETKRYKTTEGHRYQCSPGVAFDLSRQDREKKIGFGIDNRCPFALTLFVGSVDKRSGRILETKRGTANPGENVAVFVTDHDLLTSLSGDDPFFLGIQDQAWGVCRPPGQRKFSKKSDPHSVGFTVNVEPCYPSVYLYDDPDDVGYEVYDDPDDS